MKKYCMKDFIKPCERIDNYSPKITKFDLICVIFILIVVGSAPTWF